VSTALLSGRPVQALTDDAAENSVLVVGSRGAGGFAALLLGSVSRQVALSAACPVVVAREETMAVHRRIVVGVRHPGHRAALSFAFGEARQRTARLHVIYAWELFRLAAPDGSGHPDSAGSTAPETAGWLAELVAPWRQEYPEVEVVEEAVCGAPGPVLVSASVGADLVVLGRTGPHYGGGPHAGAATHAVLGHAHCPVAIVPE
jgi:nucleotide-binding universal stress UspA family protein